MFFNFHDLFDCLSRLITFDLPQTIMLSDFFPFIFMLFLFLHRHFYVLIFYFLYYFCFFGGIFEIIAAATVLFVLFLFFNYFVFTNRRISQLLRDLNTRKRKRRSI